MKQLYIEQKKVDGFGVAVSLSVALIGPALVIAALKAPEGDTSYLLLISLQAVTLLVIAHGWGLMTEEVEIPVKERRK